jgi:hypothetical protein
MTQRLEGNVKAFVAAEVLKANRRVKLDSSGELVYADAADTTCIGTTEEEAFAIGDVIGVRLLTANGTMTVTASALFAAAVGLYAANDGKVADSGTVLVGTSLEAATADNDLVEALSSPSAITGSIARSALTQQDLVPYTIPLEAYRVWDAKATLPPTSAGTDDLGLITGTVGTDAPRFRTGDAKATTVTQKTGFQFVLPAEYVAGETITLRLIAGMITTISDGTATIDANAYKVGDTGAVGSDLVATAATTINSLTAANKDFTITPTGLVAGDVLDIVVTIAITDSATATAVIGQLNKAQLLLDIKG